MTIRACAVFCGSRFGNSPIYAQAAIELGTALAQERMTLVYGGGHVGLMGTVADAALKAGGEVIGIIPEFLHDREVMHKGVTRLEITPDMHSRKARMFALADAFAILPGGFGTFDELMEILTWKQLGLHRDPIHIVNVGGWAESLVRTLHDAVEQGFAAETTLDLFDVVPTVAGLMERLRADGKLSRASARIPGQPLPEESAQTPRNGPSPDYQDREQRPVSPL